MTQEINDGGPAFPLVAEGHDHVLSIGLTLRDYFAAKALQGQLASFNDSDKRRVATYKPSEVTDMIAKTSYVMADAMLAARRTGK